VLALLVTALNTAWYISINTALNRALSRDNIAGQRVRCLTTLRSVRSSLHMLLLRAWCVIVADDVRGLQLGFAKPGRLGARVIRKAYTNYLKSSLDGLWYSCSKPEERSQAAR